MDPLQPGFTNRTRRPRSVKAGVVHHRRWASSPFRTRRSRSVETGVVHHRRILSTLRAVSHLRHWRLRIWTHPRGAPLQSTVKFNRAHRPQPAVPLKVHLSQPQRCACNLTHYTPKRCEGRDPQRLIPWQTSDPPPSDSCPVCHPRLRILHF